MERVRRRSSSSLFSHSFHSSLDLDVSFKRELEQVEELLQNCVKQRNHKLSIESLVKKAKLLRHGVIGEFRVNAGAYVLFKFVVEESEKVQIKVRPLVAGTPCQLFVTNNVDYPTTMDHMWSFLDVEKRCVLECEDPKFKIGTHYVSVYCPMNSSQTPCLFSITWTYRRRVSRLNFARYKPLELLLKEETRRRLEGFRKDPSLLESVYETFQQCESNEKSMSPLSPRLLKGKPTFQVPILVDWNSDYKQKLREQLLLVLKASYSAAKLIAMKKDITTQYRQHKLQDLLNSGKEFEENLKRMETERKTAREKLVEEAKTANRTRKKRLNVKDVYSEKNMWTLREMKMIPLHGLRGIKVGRFKGTVFMETLPDHYFHPLSNVRRTKERETWRGRPPCHRPMSSNVNINPGARRRRMKSAKQKQTAIIEERDEHDEDHGKVAIVLDKVLDLSESNAHLSIPPLMENAIPLAIGVILFCAAKEKHGLIFIPIFDESRGIFHGLEIGIVRNETDKAMSHLECVIEFPHQKRSLVIRTVEPIMLNEWNDVLIILRDITLGDLDILVNGELCQKIPKSVPMGNKLNCLRGVEGPMYLARVLLWKEEKESSNDTQLFVPFASYELTEHVGSKLDFPDSLGNHGKAFGKGSARHIVRTEHLKSKTKVHLLGSHLISLIESVDDDTEEGKESRLTIHIDQPSPENETLARSIELAENENVQEAFLEINKCLRHLGNLENSILEEALQLKDRIRQALQWKDQRLPVTNLPEFIWVPGQCDHHSYSHFSFQVRRNCDIFITLRVVDGDPDLYVNVIPLAMITNQVSVEDFPNNMTYTWASAGDGEDEVIIKSTDEDFRVGTLCISVHGATASMFDIKIITKKPTFGKPNEKRTRSNNDDDLFMDIQKNLHAKSNSYWLSKLRLPTSGS